MFYAVSSVRIRASRTKTGADIYAWHERHPGFAVIADDPSDGVWTAGWGLAVGGERYLDGVTNASAAPGLANPHALGFTGAAPAPARRCAARVSTRGRQ